jgi:hypothetical protein
MESSHKGYKCMIIVSAMHKAAPAALFKGGNASAFAFVNLNRAKMTLPVSSTTQDMSVNMKYGNP